MANDIERSWKVSNLEGLEERWRDNELWLLSGIAKLLDLRCFYYHLREECHADYERSKRVKGVLRYLQLQAYELQEHLKYCSPLGSILRSIKRTFPKVEQQVGVQSIRHLEEVGITTLEQLANLSLDELIAHGIRRDRAKLIRSYVRRRLS